MKAEKKRFEDIIKRVEEIVDRMEEGGISLEEAMKLYEEGSRSIILLTAILSEAREKVMKLVSDGENSAALKEFEEKDGDRDAG